MPGDSNQDVSQWLAWLQAGDQVSARRLWGAYFERVVRLVRSRLPGWVGLDDEVLAASAFNSFWLGTSSGRFPQLKDRHDLWGLLVGITTRKIADHLERANALKRGGGFERIALAVEFIADREPTPEVAAIVTEQFDSMMERLEKEEYRQIATWKLEGYTNREIAEKLKCAVRTVSNRLDVIRNLLIEERS